MMQSSIYWKSAYESIHTQQSVHLARYRYPNHRRPNDENILRSRDMGRRTGFVFIRQDYTFNMQMGRGFIYATQRDYGT